MKPFFPSAARRGSRPGRFSRLGWWLSRLIALFILGSLLVLLGAFLYFGVRLPFRLGRLPGDIIHRGEHTTFYFPIVTCLVLSLGLSLLFWLFGHLRK